MNAIMGIGGGFIAVPAMIYILKIPTNVAIGTSALQISLITICTILFQTTNVNVNIDLVLGLMMVVSSAIGAQIGANFFAAKLTPEYKRLCIAVLCLVIMMKMIYNQVSSSELVQITVHSPLQSEFNVWIHKLAHQHSLIYGLILIISAALSGMLANRLMRRN
jgi:hypothetical protein